MRQQMYIFIIITSYTHVYWFVIFTSSSSTSSFSWHIFFISFLVECLFKIDRKKFPHQKNLKKTKSHINRFIQCIYNKFGALHLILNNNVHNDNEKIVSLKKSDPKIIKPQQSSVPFFTTHTRTYWRALKRIFIFVSSIYPHI